MRETDARPYHQALADWNAFRSKVNTSHGFKRNIDLLIEYNGLFTQAKAMQGEQGVNETNRLLVRYGDVIREDEKLRNAYYKLKGEATDAKILPDEKVPDFMKRLTPDIIDEDKWRRHKNDTGSVSILSVGIPPTPAD